MMIAKEKITAFQKHILDWYAINKRDLPWRDMPIDTSLNARDPYKIFVSEVMAQQTQLSRVVPKYEEWMKKFPTVASLAQAKTMDVLQYWNGLGYNRRALNLKKTAEIIVEKYSGKFPRNEKDLLSLPGIGKYTARAILCFAFDQQVAVVDTNVRKVIMTQILSFEESDSLTLRDAEEVSHPKIDEKEIEQIAQQLLPKGQAYEWNQALMDYASAILKKEKIPIPKQSKFIGSHRYYRGQILKVLLKKKKVAIADLGSMIKKDYTESENSWLLKLLDELENEGFIVFTGDCIFLAS